MNVTVPHALDHRLRLDDIAALMAVRDDRACGLAATPSAASLIEASNRPGDVLFASGRATAAAPGQRRWHASAGTVLPATLAEDLA